MRSGDFRIVLTSKGESGDKEAAFGFTHIALETENMEAAIAYAKELGLVLELAENGGAQRKGLRNRDGLFQYSDEFWPDRRSEPEVTCGMLRKRKAD